MSTIEKDKQRLAGKIRAEYPNAVLYCVVQRFQHSGYQLGAVVLNNGSEVSRNFFRFRNFADKIDADVLYDLPHPAFLEDVDHNGYFEVGIRTGRIVR